MHRFFIPKESESGEKIVFSNEQSAQITRVLRFGTGDLVTTFDGVNEPFIYDKPNIKKASATDCLVYDIATIITKYGIDIVRAK